MFVPPLHPCHLTLADFVTVFQRSPRARITAQTTYTSTKHYQHYLKTDENLKTDKI